MVAEVKPRVQKIPLDMIEWRDSSTQSRVGIDRETIEEYVEVLTDALAKRKPAPFPPIDLFLDGQGRYWIGEGWHRFFTYQEAKQTNIPAIVHKGEHRDAVLFSYGANPGHGLKRSNADKRRVVAGMLADAEWKTWADARIAEHCSVGESMVRSLRNNLGAHSETRIGRNGKEYKAPKKSAKQEVVAKNYRAPRAVEGDASVPANGSPLVLHQPETEPAEEVTDIDTFAGPYRRWQRALSDCKKEFDAIARNEDVGGHLATKITRLDGLLDDARSLLRQAEPADVCKKCDGAGCQFCARTGFWTKFIVEKNEKK